MVIVGVDGCKRGWMCAVDGENGFTWVQPFEDFTQILNRDDFTLIVIDVPIGLMDKGSREADREARKLLKKRRCCVFTAPIRPVLDCRDRTEASKKWMEIEDKQCNPYTWGICPKVKEVDAAMRLDAQHQLRVREGHPEVSFAFMNNHSPIMSGKKGEEGQAHRRKLLRNVFGDFEQRLDEYADCAARVDIIDAYAMLWTARRVRSGTATSLPANPPKDRCGLRMEIVA